MRIVNLESWVDFPKAIADIRREFGSRMIKHGDERQAILKNEILFRGQSDNQWELKTTLERVTAEKYSVQRYMERADSVANEIESQTENRWQLPTYPDIVKEILAKQDSMRPHLPPPCYEYLVYLRHHGFPSPLLDWTRSPYIAAYFALEQLDDAKHGSVFAFIERPGGGKYFRGGDVMIRSMGSYITTHVRHFAQKAEYTIATRWDEDAKTHDFFSHHAVTPSPDQDILIKITIPRTDRIPALQQLEDYNINRHTLFQSEDSLVQALGLRAFELDGA